MGDESWGNFCASMSTLSSLIAAELLLISTSYSYFFDHIQEEVDDLICPLFALILKPLRVPEATRWTLDKWISHRLAAIGASTTSHILLTGRTIDWKVECYLALWKKLNWVRILMDSLKITSRSQQNKLVEHFKERKWLALSPKIHLRSWSSGGKNVQ